MMKLTKVLEKVNDDQELRDQFDLYFDFSLLEPSTDSSSDDLVVDVPLLKVGEDVSGGLFYLWLTSKDPDKCPVIYLGSEGAGGLLANSFNEFIALELACHTNWHSYEALLEDDASRSKIAEFTSEFFEEEPMFDDLKAMFIEVFKVSPMDDVCSYLDKIAESESPYLANNEGEPYGKLFAQW